MEARCWAAEWRPDDESLDYIDVRTSAEFSSSPCPILVSWHHHPPIPHSNQGVTYLLTTMMGIYVLHRIFHSPVFCILDYVSDATEWLSNPTGVLLQWKSHTLCVNRWIHWEWYQWGNLHIFNVKYPNYHFLLDLSEHFILWYSLDMAWAGHFSAGHRYVDRYIWIKI